jgi:hypothetical protein
MGKNDMVTKTRMEFELMKACDDEVAKTLKMLQNSNLDGSDDLLTNGLKKLEDSKSCDDRVEKVLKKFEGSYSIVGVDTTIFECYDDLVAVIGKKFEGSKSCYDLMLKARKKLDGPYSKPLLGKTDTERSENRAASALEKVQESRSKSKSGTTNVDNSEDPLAKDHKKIEHSKSKSEKDNPNADNDDDLLAKDHKKIKDSKPKSESESEPDTTNVGTTSERLTRTETNNPEQNSESGATSDRSKRYPPASPTYVSLISDLQNLEVSSEAGTQPIKASGGGGDEAISPKTKSGTEFQTPSRNEKKISNAARNEKKIPNEKSGTGEGRLVTMYGYDGSITTMEECLSTKSSTEGIGSMFCEHHRDYCHICRFDYRHANHLVEEDAGLRKKETFLEEFVRMGAMAKEMESMTAHCMLQQNVVYSAAKIAELRRRGVNRNDIKMASKRLVDRKMDIGYERSAIICAMAMTNPSKTELRLGGEESQKI